MSWKQSPALLSAIGLIISSSAAFAHVHTQNADDNCFKVFLPDLRQGFNVGVAALALKPGATNLNYVIFNKELPAQSPTWLEKELSPGYSAAFMVRGGFVFPTGKDINLDWTHLHSTTTAATAAPNFNFFLGPDFQIGPEGLPIRHANGKAQFRYDVINLDLGQYVNFGRQVQMRFFGGLSNAYLREQVSATYQGNVLTGIYAGPFSSSREVIANFTGLGPRFGISGAFEAGCGFGIIGSAAFSALIGNSYAKTNWASSSVELLTLYGQTLNSQWIKDQNVTQVVPAIDAKLGVSYVYPFCQGMLSFKAGYQAAVYVNAINQYLPQNFVPGSPIQTGGIFVSTMSQRLSNYSVQGYFFEGGWQF